MRQHDAGGVSPPVAIFSLKMTNFAFPDRLPACFQPAFVDYLVVKTSLFLS
jgi:hypothetical protein